MSIEIIGSGYWANNIKKYLSKEDLKYTVDSKFEKIVLWNDPEVDSVIIATPIETHYQIAKEAIIAGKNVYIEKPITSTYEEALEIKDLATDYNVVVGVDYTQIFSKSILKAKDILYELGRIEYIKMVSSSLGKFTNDNVYKVLGSHILSVLDMFMDIEFTDFRFIDNIHDNRGICTTGTILFYRGHIDVSLNNPKREFNITIYGERGTLIIDLFKENTVQLTLYNRDINKKSDMLIFEKQNYTFDERNNLKYSMDYFKNLIKGEAKSNIDMAIRVTKILDRG